MTKDEIIAKLLEHRAELEAAGAEHISLFGSVARGTDTQASDVDVLVTLSEPVRKSGFGYFGALADLKSMIETFTGRDVDVLPEPIQKEQLRRNVERERVIAF
jgi:predicted nucleotidyltransferase